MRQRVSSPLKSNQLPTIIRLRQFSADWRGTMILSACPTISRQAYGYLDIIEKRPDVHVGMVVTLLEQTEIKTLGLDTLAEYLSQKGIQWFHFPIRNMDAPSTSSEVILQELIINMVKYFNADNAVFIHCHAGLGRTGLLSATVLKSLGLSTDAAVCAIRKNRHGSIESRAQEEFVRNWKFKLPDFPPRL